MIQLSLCMIVKNEEKTLARCLDSIHDLVDEIIIVDTGSKDKTKEIAQLYTNKIYDFTWIDDFSAARNYAFSKATKEFIIWLDADDIVEDQESFRKLKSQINETIDIVMLKYHIAFDKQDNPTFSYYRERIIKNNPKYKWIGQIHEVIVPEGKVIYSDIAISHRKMDNNYSDRNLKIFKKMIKEGKKLNAREKFYYARELMYHKKYKSAIKVFNKFLDDPDAWIENKVEACKNLSFCYLNVLDKNNAYYSLLKSFTYDLPRAEICCDLAALFYQDYKYNEAIYWYKSALTCKPNEKSGAFIIKDCYDYIPYLQLCLCYYNLNAIEQAIYYNNQAGKIKPNDESYLYNKNFFETLKKSPNKTIRKK